jgi:hypothetical protein
LNLLWSQITIMSSKFIEDIYYHYIRNNFLELENVCSPIYLSHLEQLRKERHFVDGMNLHLRAIAKFESVLRLL